VSRVEGDGVDNIRLIDMVWVKLSYIVKLFKGKKSKFKLFTGVVVQTIHGCCDSNYSRRLWFKLFTGVVVQTIHGGCGSNYSRVLWFELFTEVVVRTIHGGCGSGFNVYIFTIIVILK